MHSPKHAAKFDQFMKHASSKLYTVYVDGSHGREYCNSRGDIIKLVSLRDMTVVELATNRSYKI